MARQKRMLLAGGSHADIPMIEAARALGYHVTTSGNRPDDLGHVHADETCLADFSDPQAIAGLAERLGVDALVASCNDFSALSCAWAAERLGLPGHDPYDVACMLHHKDRYRAFALANGVATPNAESCASLEEGRKTAGRIGFPLIVKPVDLTGGKGVTVVREAAELDVALQKAFAATRAGRVVLEEFLEGSRHGFSCLLSHGKVVFHFHDNEHYFLNPYLVSAASTPSQAPQSAVQDLLTTTERIASLLRLTEGIVHIQYILHRGRPVIIEICRRPPGDLYVSLVRHATGVDYPSMIVRPACGLGYSQVVQVEPTGFFTRHCVMSREAGSIAALEIAPAAQDRIIDEMMWWKPGDLIEDVLTHKMGILFFRFESQAEMLDLTEQMQDLVRPRVR